MSGEAVTINTELNTTSIPDLSSTPTRPEHVPEKFWDAEKGSVRVDDVLKSYSELEKKVGGKPPVAGETPPPAVETPPADQKVAEDLAAKGVDYAALTAEYQKDGKLSEETFADLEKRGIPRQMAEDFIAARQDQANATRSYALDGVGEERFGEVVEWAKANLQPADIKAYNTLVNSATTKEEMKAAVANLVARYEQANGSEPSLVVAKGSSPSASVYRSHAEMMKDMSDPRYAADPAFRADVAAKLGRSTIF